MSAQQVAQSVPEAFHDVPRVYFMEAAGLIKIGYTTDIDERWRKLNRSSPVPIDLIDAIPGTRTIERELHALFKHLRRRGEWFEDTPELRVEIKRLRAEAA